MYTFAEAIKFTSFRDSFWGGLVKVHLQQKLDRLIRLEHNSLGLVFLVPESYKARIYWVKIKGAH